jgi:hypothetical protein
MQCLALALRGLFYVLKPQYASLLCNLLISQLNRLPACGQLTCQHRC